MGWWIGIGIGWLLVAVVVALAMGRGIDVTERRERTHRYRIWSRHWTPPQSPDDSHRNPGAPRDPRSDNDSDAA